MANNKDTQATNKRIQQEMRDMKNKLKKEGFKAMEIDSMMRDFFAKKKTAPKKVMTAAKGGMAKTKMRGGGMAKMAQKKMMRGGMVKKKMMRGGAVKKK